MNDVNGDALRLAALERENAKLKKINAALMRRVEQGLADNGNSFTFFQVAVELEHRIQERTRALEQAMAAAVPDVSARLQWRAQIDESLWPTIDAVGQAHHEVEKVSTQR